MKKTLNLAAAVVLGGTAAYAWRRWGSDKPNPQERDRIGYPPLDTPKPVSADVWIVDSGPISVGGLTIPVRMTVIRLAEGDLLLHSPTQFTSALRAELVQLGPVRHLVAPTIGHWTFLPDWQKAFPEAEVWAVPGLRDRPQVRASGLQINHDLGEKSPPAWEKDIEQGLVHGGGGFKEAFFFHRTSRTLILADLVQNLEPSKLPALTGLVARLALAARGKTSGHVRAATLLGGESAKESIRRMLSLQPHKVIFAHGRWFDSKATDRLKRAFEWSV